MEAILRMYGELLLLTGLGAVLVLLRRMIFSKLAKEAAEGNQTSRMRKAMTLKFQKSYELHVEITNIPIFVRKYLCQERRFGISLLRWRSLPERWSGITLGTGILEAVFLYGTGMDPAVCAERLLAAGAGAVLIGMMTLLLETESLWEQTNILLIDHVANSLYPRATHVYETFEEQETETPLQAESSGRKTEVSEKKPLDRDEEKLFQEVLAELLGSSI